MPLDSRVANFSLARPSGVANFSLAHRSGVANFSLGRPSGVANFSLARPSAVNARSATSCVANRAVDRRERPSARLAL